ESTGLGADALLIEPFAGARGVGTEDAVVGADVDDPCVDQRGPRIRCAPVSLPRENLLGQRSPAARSEAVDRPAPWGIASGVDDQIPGDDGGGDLDLRV